MNRRPFLSRTVAAALFWAFLAALQSPVRAQSPPPKRQIVVHYMPWFESLPVSGHWGWHWTMNHYHPDTAVSGRPDIASQYTPLIGPYDSGDPDVLECQVLLMKLAGIDGAIIDWHGTDDFLDYGIIHRNAQRLIPILRRAGLSFSVMYEDDSVPRLIVAKRLHEGDAVAHGKTLLQWMEANWFRDPAYLKQDGRPVYLVFGTGYYRPEQWEQIFADRSPKPQFYTESHRRPPAVGAFDWPQPGGGTEKAAAERAKFYAEAKDWEAFIPAAYPRFHDIYEQAGVQKSWGRIDDREGKTFTETLEQALRSGAPLLQLVTWNDWGEGTQIEPSVEFGYRDLEAIQRLRRQFVDRTCPFTSDDLRLPIALFKERKQAASTPKAKTRLDDISAALFAGDTDRARKLLAAPARK